MKIHSKLLTAAVLLIALTSACTSTPAGESSESAIAPSRPAASGPSSQATSSGSASLPGSASPSGSAGESPSTAPAAGKPGPVRLEEIAPQGTYDRPVGLERRSGEPDKLYVVEQAGKIRLLDLADPEAKPAEVLDITDRVQDDGNEQGLLGLAFDPAHPADAYVNYTTETHTVISRFSADPSAPDRLIPSSEQVILTFEQPYSNHNGGQLAFGPDGMLYIATGDGGGAGDPRGNGQNRKSLLGKILRIDVSRQDGSRAYAIPADNPFAGGDGAPEIYAYGLRNPWRFSFDSETGRLWAADVGQNEWEEINLIEKGGNYGWNIREGNECYKPAKGCASEGLQPPVYVYDHDAGVSVTGGYVYRGRLVPGLTGWYLFSDYAFGTVWALRLKEGGGVLHETLLQTGKQITSFGTDEAGEIYVVAQDGGIFRIGKG
ncbi:glucose sorbosone dehydrogenase [Cohnella sp. CFH 77786]|uniref:PQQ-dependent sugar dehydrogenase n=1 Tax=Cohnella sp. CFH 77786 TaxID=2662265 RepID=UPI001C60D80E|nr:PQQ-dependent sugar dehydrogenase [Cohnella sp. CFH 77786]MBW5445513.1 glucose sorbosone dehydrogenase [Cohnella sp. CFH 77786]